MDAIDGAAMPDPRMAGASAGRVLLIPGLDGDPGLLMPVAPTLFRGLRVLPFDHLRDAVEDGLEPLADRALALLDADSDADAPTYVCGESFGGTVALTLARRHSERFRGLILLSAFGAFPGTLGRPARLGMLAWRLLGDRAAGLLIAAWKPFGVPGALGLRCPPSLLRDFLWRPAPYLPGYRAKCTISLAFDARPWLAEITCPTFILIGTRDPVVPPSAGRELARGIPNARLEVLPGGHLVHIVRAAEVGALIERWREASPPGSLSGAERGAGG